MAGSRFIWKKVLFRNVSRAHDTMTHNPVVLKELPEMHLSNEYTNLKKIQHLSPENDKSQIVGDRDAFRFGNTLVLPFCQGQDMLQYMQRRRFKKFQKNEKEITKMIDRAHSCVDVLNKNNFVHLDVKPENFIVSENLNNPLITLIDFQSLHKYDPHTDNVTNHPVGTPSYIAPEVRKHNQFHIKSDYWGLGLCSFMLCRDFNPLHFKRVTEDNLQDFCFNDLKENGRSLELCDKIAKWLDLDPEKR